MSPLACSTNWHSGSRSLPWTHANICSFIRSSAYFTLRICAQPFTAAVVSFTPRPPDQSQRRRAILHRSIYVAALVSGVPRALLSTSSFLQFHIARGGASGPGSKLCTEVFVWRARCIMQLVLHNVSVLCFPWWGNWVPSRLQPGKLLKCHLHRQKCAVGIHSLHPSKSTVRSRLSVRLFRPV